MSLDKALNITEEERKAIRKTYDRTDSEIEEDIQYLKDWLLKQPHLPQDEDETRLRMMLYYNKFSLEKTKTKLDLYYSLKNLVPEYYTDREPLNPKMSKIMDEINLLPLPNLNSDFNRIYLIKFLDRDPALFNVTVYFKLVFGIFDLRLVHDFSVGDQFIMDMKDARLGHLVQFTPVAIKKCYDLMQKAYSDKIKGIHFINLPSYANPFVTLINTILSEKIAGRVHVHKKQEDLKEFFAPQVLPNEYGGTAGTFEKLYDDWTTYYKSKNDWLKELAERKSDESKRIGEPMDSEIFGMYGSFRKLGVD